jgi:hypothetical protein
MSAALPIQLASGALPAQDVSLADPVARQNELQPISL